MSATAEASDAGTSKQEPEPKVLRQAGRLENFHFVRSAIKFYTNIIVSASYSSPHHLNHGILAKALHAVVTEHPIMSCGAVIKKGESASIIRLPQIDLSKVITWGESSVAHNHAREYNELIQKLHNTPFEDTEHEPLWRVAVLKKSYNYPTAAHPETNEYGRIDYEIVFCYHHGMGDGLSGAAFHYALLKALNNIDPNYHGGAGMYKTPEDIEILPSMDDKIDLGLGIKTAGKMVGFLGKAILPNFLQKTIWASGIVPEELKETRVHLHVIDARAVERFLPILKSKKTSMTAFLTYAVASSLWGGMKSLDKETYEKMKTIRASIPVSFRKHAGYSNEVISDCVSALNWNIDRIKDVSKEFSDMRKLTEALKNAAATTRDTETGLLKLVPDIEAFSRGQVGKPRDLTFEISNLGVLDTTKLGLDPKDGQGTYTKESRAAMKDPEWRIDEAVFSQSASKAGPAFSVNVATVRGRMALTIQWIDGGLDDALMLRMAQNIEQKIWTLK